DHVPGGAGSAVRSRYGPANGSVHPHGSKPSANTMPNGIDAMLMRSATIAGSPYATASTAPSDRVTMFASASIISTNVGNSDSALFLADAAAISPSVF